MLKLTQYEYKKKLFFFIWIKSRNVNAFDSLCTSNGDKALLPHQQHTDMPLNHKKSLEKEKKTNKRDHCLDPTT